MLKIVLFSQYHFTLWRKSSKILRSECCLYSIKNLDNNSIDIIFFLLALNPIYQVLVLTGVINGLARPWKLVNMSKIHDLFFIVVMSKCSKTGSLS